MDDELRLLERRLWQSGQNFCVVPGELAQRTLDYIKQELLRQKAIRNYFIPVDSDEIETRDKLIDELQSLVNDWETNE